jgi:phage shock protein A
MGHQFRMAAEIEKWTARLTRSTHSAWRGRPGSEARRALGKIGFWIAQPGLAAAGQRHLVALQRLRRDAAGVATARKRLELQITELERQADEPDKRGHQDADAGQRNTAGQLVELRRQHTDLRAREEQASAASQRLMAEINAFRAGKEATKAAYTAAEEAAKTIRRR